MNQAGGTLDSIPIRPAALAELVKLVEGGQINQTTGREVLAEMFQTGKGAGEIVQKRGLQQVSDTDFIARIVQETLDENPGEVASYQSGKVTVLNWLFGQVMRKSQGKANPQVVRTELENRLKGC